RSSCCSSLLSLVVVGLFFFSSRRRHTRFSRDWSSDVCSSDLSEALLDEAAEIVETDGSGDSMDDALFVVEHSQRRKLASLLQARSEERRVGKECRSRWSPDR